MKYNVSSYKVTAVLAVALGAGIFVFPQSVSYVIAAYLIAVGITGLLSKHD